RARSAPISYTPPVKPPPPSTSAVLERRRRPVLRCFDAEALLPRSFAAASSLTTLPMRAHCTCGYTNGRDSDRRGWFGGKVVRRVVAVVLGLLALGAAPASGQGLPDRLGAILRPAGAHAGAYVLDATSGTVLFASNAEARKPPASVEKVYTTTTALRRYGV